MCDTKKCTKCGNEFLLDQFHKQKAGRLGRKTMCMYCANAYTSEWRKNNPDKVREANAKWRKNNPDKAKSARYQWRKNNPKYHAKYHRERRAIDPDFRMINNIRSAMYSALNKKGKPGHTEDLIGCSIYELQSYLELLFQPGMTWNNYGKHGWEIDHIIPLSYFDHTDPEQQKRAWHYTNLQPMWAKDNLKKSNKIEERQLILL